MQYWEDQLFLRTADVDLNREWKTSSIFVAMQEAGGAHSEALGIGIAPLRAKDLAWVLTRVSLHLDRIPVLGETVTIRTWPSATRHAFFPRYYDFSVNGEHVGQASTLYVQLNLTTRKISAPYLPEGVTLTCPPENILPIPGNLPVLDAPVEETTREVLYSDMDINRHVNNAKYLDWYCDLFSFADHQTRQLTDVLIHYEHEVVENQTVSLRLQRENGAALLHGECDGMPCFSVWGGWRERSLV
ncbi:MAG: thioesterase [Eubacteriales bacterium]|nr:thioesterase [Eubacteriales bacterium]